METPFTVRNNSRTLRSHGPGNSMFPYNIMRNKTQSILRETNAKQENVSRGLPRLSHEGTGRLPAIEIRQKGVL